MMSNPSGTYIKVSKAGNVVKSGKAQLIDLTPTINEVTEIINKTMAIQSSWHDRLDELRKLLKPNWEYLSEGGAKIVYSHKKLPIVLKIEEGLDGGQTRTEIETAKTIPKQFQKYFCMPVASDPDGNWLIAPKAISGSRAGYDTLNKWSQKLSDKLDSLGVDVDDIGSTNVGRIGNRIVALDYGFGIIYNDPPKAK